MKTHSLNNLITCACFRFDRCPLPVFVNHSSGEGGLTLSHLTTPSFHFKLFKINKTFPSAYNWPMVLSGSWAAMTWRNWFYFHDHIYPQRAFVTISAGMRTGPVVILRRDNVIIVLLNCRVRLKVYQVVFMPSKTIPRTLKSESIVHL